MIFAARSEPNAIVFTATDAVDPAVLNDRLECLEFEKRYSIALVLRQNCG